jgi:hypothetical protein
MTQISVKTVENIVYLTGVAPTMQAKNRAEEIACQVDGVLTVENNITIQPSSSSVKHMAFDTTCLPVARQWINEQRGV